MKIFIMKALVVVVTVSLVTIGVAAYQGFTSNLANALGWANAALYFFLYAWRIIAAIEELEEWHR